MIEQQNLKRLEARVVGRVQGVGYRAFVVRNARALGLGGYVRNNRDGSVGVSAFGEAESLSRLCELLEQGPRGSRVTNVDATWSDAGGISDEEGFKVLR